jgi:cytochrome P450
MRMAVDVLGRVVGEAITYGAAGMVTTRELISVGVWHLLEDPELLAQFRAADQESRSALLQETLRLDPVSQGYDLDRFMLRVASTESRTVRPPSAAVSGA